MAYIVPAVSAFGIVAQGLLAGITAALLVLFGYPYSGVYIAVAVTLAALILWGVNRSVAKSAGGGRIWLVPTVAVAVVVLPCVALLWVPKTPVGAPTHDWESHHTLAVLAMAVLASAIFAVMWLSSVIDRCYVLPRLAGGAGKRPCTHSLDSSWRGLTRIWFLHRLIAAVVLVAATIAIVAIAANEWLLNLNQVVAAALAAATTVLGGFYLTRLPFAVAMVANPPINVGDKVLFAEMFPQPASTPHYYVSEMSLEGVKLVELTAGDDRARPETDRPYDRILDLGEIHKLLRARDAFGPCGECRGVNLYCGRPHPTAKRA
jgi:uncharacterized protein YneF (UPF0154 family)